jgi:hypothetical protein
MHPYALTKHPNNIINYYFSKNQIDSHKMHRISTKYILKLKAHIHKIYTKPPYVVELNFNKLIREGLMMLVYKKLVISKNI